jgi:restriction system protein
MKFALHENSLFAILMRSQWWVSFLIAGALTALMTTVLPEAYRLAGIIAGVPFFVTGGIAAWRQWQAPSAKRIERTLEAVRAMPWTDFSRALEQAYRRDGYDVQAVKGPAADFEIRKEWRRSLVSGKRWKVARTGIEPLRELVKAKDEHEAHDCIYIATGEITDNAREFATRHAVKLVGGAELARLMPYAGRGRKAA